MSDVTRCDPPKKVNRSTATDALKDAALAFAEAEDKGLPTRDLLGDLCQAARTLYQARCIWEEWKKGPRDRKTRPNYARITTEDDMKAPDQEELIERLANTLPSVDMRDIHDRDGHTVGVIAQGGSHIRYGCLVCGRQFVDVVSSDPYTRSETSPDWKLPCAPYKAVLAQRAIRLALSDTIVGMTPEQIREHLRD